VAKKPQNLVNFLVDQYLVWLYTRGIVNNKEHTMIDAKYKTQFYVDETREDTGPVVRWNSNDRIPFPDMLENFRKAGWIDAQTEQNSLVQRKVEDAQAIAQYVAAREQFGYSDEERFEMRAAFAAGTRVTDVFTGRTITI
jgi:hypothetical protein